MPLFARLPLLLLVAALAACGFQPRGSAPGAALPDALRIVGAAPGSALGRELRRQLRAAGVDLDRGETVIRILDHESGRRLLSLDARNRAAEYELAETVRYRLIRGARRDAPQTLRVTRIQFEPGDQLLGRRHEEDRLREEMRRELVRRLLRRIAATH